MRVVIDAGEAAEPERTFEAAASRSDASAAALALCPGGVLAGSHRAEPMPAERLGALGVTPLPGGNRAATLRDHATIGSFGAQGWHHGEQNHTTVGAPRSQRPAPRSRRGGEARPLRRRHGQVHHAAAR